jgi:hypothetical protein
MPHKIVGLVHVRTRLIVQGKSRGIVQFGAKIFISAMGDCFTIFARLSYSPSNEVEEMNAFGMLTSELTLSNIYQRRPDLLHNSKSSFLSAQCNSVDWSAYSPSEERSISVG